MTPPPSVTLLASLSKIAAKTPLPEVSKLLSAVHVTTKLLLVKVAMAGNPWLPLI